MGKILWSYWFFFSDTWFFPTFFSTRTCTETWFSTTTHSSYIHTIATSGFFSFTNTNIFAAMRIFVSVFFLYFIFLFSLFILSFSLSVLLFPIQQLHLFIVSFSEEKRDRIENFMEIGKVFSVSSFILFIEIRWKIKVLTALTSGRKCNEKNVLILTEFLWVLQCLWTWFYFSFAHLYVQCIKSISLLSIAQNIYFQPFADTLEICRKK